MPNPVRKASEIFNAVLAQAKQELLIDGAKAEAFLHKGIRGDERAAAFSRFLREKLPEKFGVGKGEVIDHLDQRSGQLDVMIYDQASCAPISRQNENVLLPCEALYAVVEVKTTISQKELNTSFLAAGKIRALRPFGATFVAPRQDGLPANDKNHRCMYIIFGYTSDLANDSKWLEKENERARLAASEAGISLDCVDRIIVLDRGMLHPANSGGSWDTDSDATVFLESYLHIVNLLNRESRRREPVDWQLYAPRGSRSWTKLPGGARANARCPVYVKP